MPAWAIHFRSVSFETCTRDRVTRRFLASILKSCLPEGFTRKWRVPCWLSSWAARYSRAVRPHPWTSAPQAPAVTPPADTRHCPARTPTVGAAVRRSMSERAAAPAGRWPAVLQRPATWAVQGGRNRTRRRLSARDRCRDLRPICDRQTSGSPGVCPGLARRSE